MVEENGLIFRKQSTSQGTKEVTIFLFILAQFLKLLQELCLFQMDTLQVMYSQNMLMVAQLKPIGQPISVPKIFQTFIMQQAVLQDIRFLSLRVFSMLIPI